MDPETINQYDVIELTEDINPKIKKGMQGVVLERFDVNNFEVEVLDSQGQTIRFKDQFTFTVNKRQIRKIG